MNPSPMIHELNERSREIFREIVETFFRTGEPVGSRTLSRRLQLPLSPATVRNVMADLEEMGLVRFGDTHVLCTATVEDRVPPFLRKSGRGWVTAEYGMLPRSRLMGRSISWDRALISLIKTMVRSVKFSW